MLIKKQYATEKLRTKWVTPVPAAWRLSGIIVTCPMSSQHRHFTVSQPLGPLVGFLLQFSEAL